MHRIFILQRNEISPTFLSNPSKITSGSNPEAADKIDWLYQQIIEAGTFKATSLKVAEAAKVIENTQRDVNIALINELSLIFSKLEIDTLEVLERRQREAGLRIANIVQGVGRQRQGVRLVQLQMSQTIQGCDAVPFSRGHETAPSIPGR